MIEADAVLVQQVIAGDSQAFEFLVDRHKGVVFARVVSKTGRFDGAEDTVQDAFVEAYLHLNRLKEPAKFSSWLCGIAVNLCRQGQRARRREVSIDQDSDPDGESSDHSNRVVLPLPSSLLPDAALEA